MIFPSKPEAEKPLSASTPVPAYPPPELDEIIGDKVLQWRCKQFLDAGFDLHQARRLTCDRTVDVRYVIDRLVSRGCTTDLAYRIAS